MESKVRFEIRTSAFSNRLQDFAVVNVLHIDLIDFLHDSGVIFVDKIDSILEEEFHIIKVNSCFKAEFIKTSADGDEVKQVLYIQTNNETIDIDSDMITWYTINIVNPVIVKCEDFEIEGSGWTGLDSE